ncbi:MAG: VWA domain-containing protein [Anaerolineales bacterium]|nr:VWA domain-containing protein [Anaerolineales bacterium]
MAGLSSPPTSAEAGGLVRFTAPLYLLLLLLAPLAVWMGYPAKAARRRETVSLILRVSILLCLIFSIAGLEIVKSGDNLAVVFLMDVSDSMPEEALQAEASFVQSAISAMGPDDQSALVLFGADALVDRPMSAVNELAAITSVPITNQTNLAEAIRLGMALFPSGAARRMVILSDGAETSGDAKAAAKFAADSGIELVVVPFANQVGVEALISNVDAPTHLRPGENFDLNVTVNASQQSSAVLRVLAGAEILYEKEHKLRRGSQTFSLPLTAGESGFVSYQVQIVPSADTFYQNNRLDAFSQVEGPPRILMVAMQPGEELIGGEVRPDEYSALKEILQSAGFSVELITPQTFPLDLPTLAQYNSVVLVDVPAKNFSQQQMELLRSYVRDLGGGLVAVGGPTSYGVGGYYGTPIEDALPVDMEIKDEQRRPSLAIVFIIDHSGSMLDASGGVMKLELAKEAAARSVELLFPSDRVGVVQFDDAASWVVPMTDLTDPDAITSAIGGIQGGGGTNIMAGIQAMASVLPDDPAKVKHVILLTDGGADPTGIPELVEKLYTENGITLSTVGVGSDAAPFLADLAKIGGGRYHFTDDASSIPSIFTEETSLATRSYIVEENFFPALVNSSPILANLDSVPQLRGYVASSPKDLAQVILKSEKDDPILAAWQYGLGRSVAFTSDATGRWAQDWVRWEGFPTFWAQAVRYTIGENLDSAIELNVSPNGEIQLDAQSRSGQFLNEYQITANIVAPNGEAQTVILNQTAPGRYAGNFSPNEQGVYLFNLSGKQDEKSLAFSETTGWALSYSPEYQRLDSNPDLLIRLAALSNGKVASANPADVFAHDLKSTRASRPVWQWLVLLAALLLPLDIAIRRLIITKQDIAKVREWALSKFNLQPAQKPQPLPADSRLQALKKAKDRTAREPVSAEVSLIIEEEEEEEEAPAQPVKAEPKPDENKSTTSALLERKRNAKK